MTSRPIQIKRARPPGARPKQPLRARAADKGHGPMDPDDPCLLPKELRERLDPAAVVASLEAQVEEVRAGRAQGTDGDAFFAEWRQELKRLGA